MTIGPEEVVRQEFVRILTEDYGYLDSEIEIEFTIPRGSSNKDRADIAVFKPGAGRDPAKDVLGLVETKRPGTSKGLAQLKSYMTATSSVWGVWTNGEDIEYLCKPAGTPTVLDDVLNNVPVRGQRVEDVGSLIKADLKPYGGTALKVSFRRILNTLYANTNISRREKLGNEMIKLIFAKIRDEVTYPDNPPMFRAGYGEDADAVKDRINSLFESVVDEYGDDGLFERHERITLDAKGVAWVVGQLERGSLIETPSDVVGDAFEVFAESKFVGEKGEFFTPRDVINVAVKIADVRPEMTVCDPACGSGGFLIAAMRSMWRQMDDSKKWGSLQKSRLDEAKKKMAARCFFGIDKESDLVRIAKAYMAISGDGRSNVVHENSLHSAGEFDGEAARRFIDNGIFKQFDFILTNPPFGTKTKVLKEDASNFDLGHSWTWKRDRYRKGAPRDTDPYVLFVERWFDMLKTEGTLAAVLPETAFHAPSMCHFRSWLLDKGRLMAVIDLPHNTFRPYCNAKTCLMVLRKGAATLSDDMVLMAEAVEMGHDHNGREIHDPQTGEIWNDLLPILKELDDPGNPKNNFVFKVQWRDVEQAGHLIPRYFAQPHDMLAPAGREWVSLGDLVDEGAIEAWDGNGSPSSSEKGEGNIPYIRVSDVVNWELYRNPVSGVSNETYERMTKNHPPPLEGDVIFVRRGSYRIGTVAMVSPRDTKMVMTRELLTLRVKKENCRNITPYYLLMLLSSEVVQKQMRRLTFIDTTLPNIGDRWRELRLPIHSDSYRVSHFESRVREAIQKKWEAQKSIDLLRDDVGEIIT
ncbi:MAG: N-6 DNA methylase [Gammaproteobacteria bacterium]|nr:N-6 DNA methylase [Gammaproteobacteria bacterium]